MAKEKNLTTVTSIAAADFARLVTSAGASVKATAANLAKYIIETYNGSTVAGSAQSVKSALDSLNSKSEGLSNANSITLTMSNTPSSSHFGNAFIVNANVGTVAMARIDTNPTITALHGTITYSISVSGNTYTITPSGRLWGLTQVFFNEV